MEKMMAFFASLNILSEEELQNAQFESKKIKLKKGEYFIREGRTCKNVAFIDSGILRSFFIKENGEEVTYCLTFRDRFMTAYTSLITGEPAQENIQAIADTELYVITKDEIERKMAESANWIKVQKYFAEEMYIELERRIFSYQKEKAKERYQQLLENYPEYVEQIPLQYLASYLNITPRHLSRIRSELV